MEKDQDKIYKQIEKIFKKYSKGEGLEILEGKLPGSTAKGNKEQITLMGKVEKSVLGRKPQKTYFAGLIKQKGYVGFYYMCDYSHPKLIKIKNAYLKKSKSGKSCFHIKQTDKDILNEIDSLLAEGVKIYKKEKWI